MSFLQSRGAERSQRLFDLWTGHDARVPHGIYRIPSMITTKNGQRVSTHTHSVGLLRTSCAFTGLCCPLLNQERLLLCTGTIIAFAQARVHSTDSTPSSVVMRRSFDVKHDEIPATHPIAVDVFMARPHSLAGTARVVVQDGASWEPTRTILPDYFNATEQVGEQTPQHGL